ncbi:hypothetical protein DS901_05830 [Loktanella sp. D2R18]|nr:hypothetical protein DS901_05830 [Loktanella sp. D2R18]
MLFWGLFCLRVALMGVIRNLIKFCVQYPRCQREVCGYCRVGKKVPGTGPGEVQQGGESDERVSIFAFKGSNRA